MNYLSLMLLLGVTLIVGDALGEAYAPISGNTTAALSARCATLEARYAAIEERCHKLETDFSTLAKRFGIDVSTLDAGK